MDHMLISGTEPPVILSQTKKFKSWSDTQKVPNQAKAKRDGVIYLQNDIFCGYITPYNYNYKYYNFNSLKLVHYFGMWIK